MSNTLFLENQPSILQDYKNGMGIVLLGKKYNIPKTTIYYNLSKQGIIRNKTIAIRKYQINEHFFSKIDDEYKAYLLGFIYADGCINGIQLNITLHPKDIEIIDLFIKYISPNRTPQYIKKFYVKFGVYNRQLSDDLRRCGVTEKKSLTIKFPSTKIVPDHLQNHFIRGIFDGDGTIFSLKNRPNTYATKLMGSNPLIYSITNLLKNKNINGHRYPKGRVSEFVINNNKSEILKFYKFLYENATIYLLRKKKKFEELETLASGVVITNVKV